MIAQHAGESSAQFEARGFAEIAGADAPTSPEMAVLIANGDAGTDALAMRENLLRALIGSVELERHARVVLVADGGSDSRKLGAQLALSLNEELEQEGSHVRLRFRAQPHTVPEMPAVKVA